MSDTELLHQALDKIQSMGNENARLREEVTRLEALHALPCPKGHVEENARLKERVKELESNPVKCCGKDSDCNKALARVKELIVQNERHAAEMRKAEDRAAGLQRLMHNDSKELRRLCADRDFWKAEAVARADERAKEEHAIPDGVTMIGSDMLASIKVRAHLAEEELAALTAERDGWKRKQEIDWAQCLDAREMFHASQARLAALSGVLEEARAERVRAERLWERSCSELDAAREAAGLFASAIKSGERWSDACEKAYSRAFPAPNAATKPCDHDWDTLHPADDIKKIVGRRCEKCWVIEMYQYAPAPEATYDPLLIHVSKRSQEDWKLLDEPAPAPEEKPCEHNFTDDGGICVHCGAAPEEKP